eukprot:GFYU01001090.1.p1 GENE.GFYU01001090.1~~GFYU01001090.1.p1  ORF type:complete len:443 (+),score=127.94 GFYU01001090.1:40-1329(+)
MSRGKSPSLVGMSPSPSVEPTPNRELDLTRDTVKILLMENVHANGVKLLKDQGFQVEAVAKLDPETLKQKIREVHAIGVRSKTQLTAELLAEAKNLLCVGCFCIGTDQTDLVYTEKSGIPVFNAPFSNTRSVAELVLAEMVCLARQIGDRSREMHEGVWNKVSKGCYEIRGKTLGIVGYGHVGSQVSVLAESCGMRVIYYDTVPKLAHGNASQVATLDELLTSSDFVTLHVPLTEATKNMIGEKELNLMKKGAYFLNLARGQVVDLPALAAALNSGHIAGCAVDVYPKEPAGNGPGWENPLQGCPNTILTPHIGGSTEEAQAAIGVEVAHKLVSYINFGSTVGAVNFPELEIPSTGKGTRIINIHKNEPGVLMKINEILANCGANVNSQVLGTTNEIGYYLCKIEESKLGPQVRDQIAAMSTNIRTRLF